MIYEEMGINVYFDNDKVKFKLSTYYNKAN